MSTNDRTTDTAACAECGLPIREPPYRIWADGGKRHMDCSDAKDAEIERLRAANAELRENARMWAKAAGAIFEDMSNG